MNFKEAVLADRFLSTEEIQIIRSIEFWEEWLLRNFTADFNVYYDKDDNSIVTEIFFMKFRYSFIRPHSYTIVSSVKAAFKEFILCLFN